MKQLRAVLSSDTFRLASTYLLIIMIMSIAFSVVLYHTSDHQLGRQLPPDQIVESSYQQPLDSFFRHRIDEGRHELRIRLIVLNGTALILGSLVSYLLARRALEPIEAAMEAQAQFVSDASHELRTPLTAILTSNEVVLRRRGLTLADAKQTISQNMEDVQRLQQLADGLLTLARHDNAQPAFSQVDLSDITSQALSSVVPQATAKDISVDDKVGALKVAGDAAALRQVIVVLLDNAVKYSPDGGTVEVSASSRGKSAFITVSDNGPGIAAADLPHLFKRFYRADNSRTSDKGTSPGYGLGLAIAQRIAVDHGGKISVVSQPGQGSTFTLRLPLAN